MLHKMKLKKEPFEKIRNGSKTIELRLYDEKRQQVQNGDFIEFSLMDNPKEKLQTQVTALHRFDSFQELYSSLPKEKLGYKSGETPVPNHMDEYYSREEQEKYGVIGIEIHLTDLQKFIDAQDYGYDFNETYQTALDEMKHGRKATHWIWYVFPQIKGLGRSYTAVCFSIRDLHEAKEYCKHPVLGARLQEITSVLLNIENDDPVTVFGYTDAVKVCSCMTLFKYAAPDNDLFQKVLDKFFHGKEDDKTVDLLGL